MWVEPMRSKILTSGGLPGQDGVAIGLQNSWMVSLLVAERLSRHWLTAPLYWGHILSLQCCESGLRDNWSKLC